MFDLQPLFRMPEGVTTRWASPENWTGAKGAAGQANGGRKGSACFRLRAGEQKVLAEVRGSSGTVRRIWVTLSDRTPAMLRGIRIDMFWDGAATPAVSAPLGDFFGHALGRCTSFESALLSSPEARSFNCVAPMPFRSGMKIVAANESGADLPMFFYDVDYTLGDRHGNDALWFHAYWHRENPTVLQRDYEILPAVTGRGRYLGATLGVIADKDAYFTAWWGEGECKIYLDGDDEYPTLCGTGTEDYIGTGWGQGTYAHRYQGCPLADGQNRQYVFYRYHIPDPVYFQRDIRVTVQQIGCWGPEQIRQMRDAGRRLVSGPGREPIDMNAAVEAAGHGLFERRDDWSSCAYFYLGRPESDLPSLAPVEMRVADLLAPTGEDSRADV